MLTYFDHDYFDHIFDTMPLLLFVFCFSLVWLSLSSFHFISLQVSYCYIFSLSHCLKLLVENENGPGRKFSHWVESDSIRIVCCFSAGVPNDGVHEGSLQLSSWQLPEGSRRHRRPVSWPGAWLRSKGCFCGEKPERILGHYAWLVSSRCCGGAHTTGCISLYVPVRVGVFEHGWRWKSNCETAWLTLNLICAALFQKWNRTLRHTRQNKCKSLIYLYASSVTFLYAFYRPNKFRKNITNRFVVIYFHVITVVGNGELAH